MKSFFLLCVSIGCIVTSAFSQDSVDVNFSFTAGSNVFSVSLVGEFNGWNNAAWPMTAKGNGLFERVARLRVGGPASGGGVAGGYMYKFYTGTSPWPNDPLNPYSNPNDNNNSIIYVKSPTIFHLLPNQLVGTIRTSRPMVTAGIYPKVGSVLDTASLTLRIDSVTFNNLGTFYDTNKMTFTYSLPSVLQNGTHKMWLTIGSVSDSVSFTVAANPVQIETPSFTTRKTSYVTAGFVIRPDGLGIDSTLTSATISVKGVQRSIAVTNGTFIDSTSLAEGTNWIVVSTPSGKDSVLVTRLVNHTPMAAATAQLSGNSVTLDASTSTDPDGQTLTNFKWIDDPVFPLSLSGQTGASASVFKPSLSGEYYYGLIVTAPDGHADTARFYFIVNIDGSVSTPTIASNPEWAKRGRIYFLFPKAASSAGTLNGAAQRLSNIKDMGFNIIWMMPVMVNAYPINQQSGPGYNIVDFYKVAPEYGTNQDFKNFVAQAHSLGLKVILDVTPNHTSYKHPWAADAKTNKQKSPYWNWYQHTIIPHNDNGLGQSLDADGFNYYSGFSEQLLNYNWTDVDAQAEMINVYKYWIKEFGLDGYRFDVYWGPHRRYGEQYMGRPVRDALKHIKPDIFLLAEDDGTGGGTEYIYADSLGGVDAAYDFKLFFNQIRGFGFNSTAVTNLHNEIWNGPIAAPFFPGPNSMFMRFMESQDEDRIAYAYSANGALDATTTFMKTMPMSSTIFTVPGIPMIWNGQEVGKGYGDNNFDSRRRGTIDWNFSGKTLLAPHYQKLAHIRGQFKAFSTQQFIRINSGNGLVYAFTRPFYKEDGIVAVNFGSVSANIALTVSVSELSSWFQEGKNYILSDLYNGGTYPVQLIGGSITLNATLNPYGTAIFVLADSAKQVLIPTSIEKDRSEIIPSKIQLYQNYPNPFNPSTTIHFDLPKQEQVRIHIFNILGKEVADVVNSIFSVGTHQVLWDGRTNSGTVASSGVYFVRFEAGSIVDTKKIVLMK